MTRSPLPGSTRGCRTGNDDLQQRAATRSRAGTNIRQYSGRLPPVIQQAPDRLHEVECCINIGHHDHGGSDPQPGVLKLVVDRIQAARDLNR
jgi:hypothetical protein